MLVGSHMEEATAAVRFIPLKRDDEISMHTVYFG